MPAAQWRQVRQGTSELVTLADGDLSIHVRKQAAGERFIVDVPDGEIEVRGTTFEVGVRHGMTESVHVDEGVVVIRIRHREEATLRSGESWSPELGGPNATAPRAALPTPAPSQAILAPTTATPANGAQVAHPSLQARPGGHAVDETADYETAMGLYRGGQFKAAADAFHRFVTTYPTSGLSDDASFLEASALASAGRSDAAALAAERHLGRFPDSFHRRDDSILIARDARDRGDCDAARRVLAPWLDPTKTDGSVLRALGGCSAR
jgi:TolA-binding protein